FENAVRRIGAQAQRERALADAEIGRGIPYAQMTGINPWTGRPTFAAQQQAGAAADRGARTDLETDRINFDRFKSIVENSPTGAVLTRELAELGGLPSSMIGTRLVHRPNGTHFFVGTDANGRPIQMQVGQGGYAEPVLTGAGGQAAGVYERPERPE